MPPIIAKLCGSGNLHFAPKVGHAHGMAETSINRVIAEALRDYMAAGGWTAASLSKETGLSDRTIGNFLHPERREPTKSGKEGSAKVTELAILAEAMGLRVVDLVDDQVTTEQRKAHLRKRAAEHYMSTGNFPKWAPLQAPEAKRNGTDG